MEAKWPFLLLVLFFVALTGYVMSQLERTKVMRQWDNRRCDFTVMLAARFFKPDADPRSPEAFSGDNFDFCVKEYSEGFLRILLVPVTWLMGKQAGLTGEAMNAMNTVKAVTKRVMDGFLSYLSSYTKKLQASMFELRRIFTYLRMGIQRMSAIAMSTIYMGMTLFRGMISSIQVIIRVILIICAIMLAVIIILWFILLPIIPFILTTLTAVVALVGALSVVMSTSLSSQAESQKGGFCFAEDTLVRVRITTDTDENGSKTVPIKEVQVGDILEDGSEVTMVMEATSDNVEWYELDGIWVAGDHRIQSETGAWCLVREDPRAVPSSSLVLRVFCLNTTTRQIPLHGKNGLYLFRDWEELEEEDTEGHRIWREQVLQLLNPTEQGGNNLDTPQDIPLVGGAVEVHTLTGWKAISEIKVGDVLMTHAGQKQHVIGMVRGSPVYPSPSPSPSPVSNQWFQGGYVWDTLHTKWQPAPLEGFPSPQETGWNLVTETGEWMARTTSGITRRRDFTEVGHTAIKNLYDMVSSRLRSSSPSSHSAQ